MKKYPLLPGILLFILSLLAGILTYQDFGISWDEPVQREMGYVSYNYIFENDTTLNHYLERDHGVGFELPLVFVEKSMGITDSREIYLMRHIASHIFFLLGGFAMYVLCYFTFRSRWLATAGFLMVVLHPRLYAHSFINSKDTPLLVAFIFCYLCSYIAFKKQRWGWMMLAGAAVGYATSIRILGIVPGAALLGFLVIDLIMAAAKKQSPRRPLLHLVSFCSGFCLLLYIAWPVLWQSPVSSFVECFRSLSHFRWDYKVLFEGKKILASKLPAHYLPAWIAITTPAIWLLACLAGLILVFAKALRRPLHYLTDVSDRQFLLYLYCTIAPVAMILILDSIVYDDWRHVYFIYPSFVMLALYAIHGLRKQSWKNLAVAAILAQAGLTVYDLVRLHPFPQVYFNRLVSHKSEYLRMHYEMDYWGCSYKQALEYLIAHDPEHDIKIQWGSPPLLINCDILQKQDRSRIKFLQPWESNYFITTFRTNPEDLPYPETVYEIKRLNSTILRIYKIR
jgi:hypothetical protein